MGEFHPAEKKVVVQFSPADMKLTPVQAEKLKKLAGPRYNPEKNEIKMSCESFDQPAQNKRFLSDQVDALVDAAKVRGACPLPTLSLSLSLPLTLPKKTLLAILGLPRLGATGQDELDLTGRLTG